MPSKPATPARAETGNVTFSVRRSSHTNARRRQWICTELMDWIEDLDPVRSLGRDSTCEEMRFVRIGAIPATLSCGRSRIDLFDCFTA